MFEAKLNDGSIWKKLIDSIKDLLTEGMLECGENGISLQAMDSSHVSLVSFNMSSNGFDTYRCDREMCMGVTIASMAKILKCASNDDKIKLQREENSNILKFTFENASTRLYIIISIFLALERVSHYELKLIDLDTDRLAVPETDYNSSIKLPSNEFTRVIRDMASLGESVIIECSKGEVRFSSSGDIGKGQTILRSTASTDEPESAILINVSESLSMSFNLKYMTMFTKGAVLSNRVVLSMCVDVPIVIEYDIVDFGKLCYYLAPKIEDAEE
ncbi:hypothetical protein A3Q56_02942 [Intoshia linei]|uniref:DNA sliding clamp PCNA n=1 Tax=Intoshia linei TaxID=1819745 RepID=A0A177B4X9_9BILA|nr:hypothetical protein A3Q56_02942 [Intoshia linei]